MNIVRVLSSLSALSLVFSLSAHAQSDDLGEMKVPFVGYYRPIDYANYILNEATRAPGAFPRPVGRFRVDLSALPDEVAEAVEQSLTAATSKNPPKRPLGEDYSGVQIVYGELFEDPIEGPRTPAVEPLRRLPPMTRSLSREEIREAKRREQENRIDEMDVWSRQQQAELACIPLLIAIVK